MVAGIKRRSALGVRPVTSIGLVSVYHAQTLSWRYSLKNFRDLEVWKHAHSLTLEAYRQTKTFPSDERFGLTSQIRRRAASIPANIAEGCGRRGDAEFHRFLQIAMGSASELEYHLLLAKDLEYFDSKIYLA